MKNLTTLFLVICSLTTYSQKLSINNARALEGASVKFILTLDAATSPFVVEVKFTDNEAKGAATKSKKYKLETNDYSNVKQYIAFDGTAGESKDFYVPTYQDSDRSEGDERFTVNLSTNSGAVTVPGSVVGVIEDVPCRYCPSSSFLYNAEQFRIEFFGDGSLQNSLDKGTDIAANTGVGVVAKKYFKNLPGQKFGPWYRVDLAAIINVASTIDTLIADFDASNAITNQRAFGSSVLTPLSTGDAVNLSLLLYNKETWLGLVSGIEFQYLGSNRNWQFTNTEIFNVNTSFIKFTLFHDFVNYDKRDDFTLMFKAGYTHHWIGGDLANNRPDLSRFLGTGQRRYDGFDLGLRFKLKNLNADFSYVQFVNATDVPGLTGGRLITTISFIGGFGIKLQE